MKNKVTYILLITLLSFFSTINAQQLNYPVKVVDGIEYYIYSVEAGEGLYSISRRFGVSQSEINNVNPQIHDGLKAGQDILIPKKDEKSTMDIPAVSDDVEYVLHTVEKRQTLFSISRKFNTTQDAIIQSNPQIRDRGIQAGDILRIPVAKKTSAAPSTPSAATVQPAASSDRTLHIGNEENYVTHNVSQGETLYSISRKYNVKVNDLKNLNPEVSEGLKAGTVLKIPFNNKGNTVVTTTSPNVRKSTTVEQKTTYKIAYLLPFMLNDRNDPTVAKFIEFYLGSLLAVNNNRNGAMKYQVFTFDTEKTETKLFEIINKPEMQKMDLIIGPAYTAQIPILADFAMRHEINTIIPFSSKVAHIENNPYLFQFNPEQDLQNEFAVNIFKTDFKNGNIVFVETANSGQSASASDALFLRKELDRLKIGYNVVKSSQITDWNAMLASNKNNVVVFNSDKYSDVQSHLNNLYEVSTAYDVAVLGQYGWRNHQGKKPKMYYISPFTGSKLGTQYYEQEYRKHYGEKLPLINPRYDLLGYDLTTFFMSTMKPAGFEFNTSTHTLNYNKSVQSDFKFKRVGKNGGFVNQQLYLIEDEATAK